MKQQGVSRGFPDYLILVANTIVAIELKRLKGSRTSPERIDWLVSLNAAGVRASVCQGWVAAKRFIESVERPTNLDDWASEAVGDLSQRETS